MSHLRSIKHIGLALVAVLLLGGIAAASASAAKFEAKPSFSVKFTATGGEGFLETEAGRKVTCASAEGSGEVAGAEAVANVKVKFKGCFTVVKTPGEKEFKVECQSGAELGVIETEVIKGRPVDTNAAKTEAGILLEPKGTLFAEFKCGLVETLKVKGSIIGKVPNAQLNEFRTTLNLEFETKGGKPVPKENGVTEHNLLTEGIGPELFEFENSGIQEKTVGETKTTALEGKEIKLVP